MEQLILLLVDNSSYQQILLLFLETSLGLFRSVEISNKKVLQPCSPGILQVGTCGAEDNIMEWFTKHMQNGKQIKNLHP